MRGRVGRSKTRAYAYLTYNENSGLTDAAEKRLKVMQSLDSLGAGFNLASYDLDLRGAGNLVGEEQSGHIKEVGFELYQAMLEEAVAERQGEAAVKKAGHRKSMSAFRCLIPETYVPDLDLRMGLYRRLSGLTERADIDAFAAEVVDRFGPLPAEVQHLLSVLAIKIDCLAAGIEKIDAGPKGAVFFRNQTFARPEKLIAHVSENQARIKIRPDQSLVFRAKARTPMNVCEFRGSSCRRNWRHWLPDY
jgi:transcription-repair coupling factor (superfamily II helicase)